VADVVLAWLRGVWAGRIGIVDHDTVSRSNLHRQVLHGEATIGWLKVDSAKAALQRYPFPLAYAEVERADACPLQRLNPHVRVTTHDEALSPSNALALLQPYSLILDCTDRPLTRYLISDACVLSGKPLVSGAALGFNGQLAVYNWGPDSPCYRCVWPRVAKQPAGKGTCEEEGVLGPVTGVIGTLMALEAVKIIAGLARTSAAVEPDPSRPALIAGPPRAPLTTEAEPTPPGLLIFSALSPASPFRTFKLRRRQPHCRSCGSPPADSTLSGKIVDLEREDYNAFCGGPEVDQDRSGLEDDGTGLARISATVRLRFRPRPIRPYTAYWPVPSIRSQDLASRLASADALPNFIDVRTAEQFSIISIPGSRSRSPFSLSQEHINADPLAHRSLGRQMSPLPTFSPSLSTTSPPPPAEPRTLSSSVDAATTRKTRRAPWPRLRDRLTRNGRSQLSTSGAG
jgi:molybdopterin/thiamine biosynthesis adenylyltransferase